MVFKDIVDRFSIDRMEDETDAEFVARVEKANVCHTPGPWERVPSYSRHDAGKIIGPLWHSFWGYPPIAQALQHDPDPIYGCGIPQATANANADRIVACVNALEGINDPSRVPLILKIVWNISVNERMEPGDLAKSTRESTESLIRNLHTLLQGFGYPTGGS